MTYIVSSGALNSTHSPGVSPGGVNTHSEHELIMGGAGVGSKGRDQGDSPPKFENVRLLNTMSE